MSKEKSLHLRRRLPIAGAADRRKRRKMPTKAEPLIVSASELRTFLRCRVKWSWRYHHRIIPREKPQALEMGGLVHQMLELWYSLPKKKRSVKAAEYVTSKVLDDTDPESLTLEDLELAKAMVIGYAEWAKMRDHELGMGGVKTEVWFDEPLTDDESIRVRGKIDAIFKQAELAKTIGALEHKTASQIRINVVDLNLQLSVYLWALRKLYPSAKRYVAHYNVLRKQMPTPRVRAPLFARESVERTPEEIAQWELDVQRAALDMLDAAIYPNPTKNCSWDCDYQVPCLLRGRPNDVKAVMENDFTRKD